MKKNIATKILLGLSVLACSTSTYAQTVERERPAEWQQLVPGARFMDRFLAMPEGTQGKQTWGTDSVQNRYTDNGIELPDISFGEAISSRLPTNGIIYMYADGRKTHPKDTCSGLIRPSFTPPPIN